LGKTHRPGSTGSRNVRNLIPDGKKGGGETDEWKQAKNDNKSNFPGKIRKKLERRSWKGKSGKPTKRNRQEILKKRV